MEKGIDSDEDGVHRRTRFPCLATARYVVAAVVSVLTVAVIVMVIIVALRPEKVIFSIPRQYILADGHWWDDDAISSEHPPIPSRVAGGTATSTKRAGTVIINNDPNTNFPLGGTTETPTYFPVKTVRFLVSFAAYNPSGRADVSGENVTIRVLDMPDYGSLNFSFQTTTLTEIITYELQDNFKVNRQTSHTLRQWIPVNDTAVLYYLADMYGGSTSFTAMVQVNVTIVPSVHVASTEPQIYYCWPVIVSTEYSGYDRSTSCRPEKEMDSIVNYSWPPLPAPEPVPAPAPAPTAAAPLLS